MADKTHLKNRNGWWHFQRRRPDGGHQVFSLKTKSLKEAQRKRDEYLKEWEVAKEEADAEIRLNKLAREYRASRSEREREHHSDKAMEAAEDFAYKTGVYQSMMEKTTFRPDEELTEAEQAPINRYRHVMGQAHILAELKEDWLASLTKPQRGAYAPALDRLMSKVTLAEQVLPDGEKLKPNCIFASEYIETASKEFGLARATVSKDNAALVHLWSSLAGLKKNKKMWLGNSLPETPELNKPRVAWKNSEVLHILEAAKTSDSLPPWLYHVIKIAAYTGARQGAICHPKTQYSPQTNEIWFPPLKFETMGRNIHVHSEIVDSVKFWMGGGRVSAASVGGQFTKFRRDLGYPDTKVFHGLRNAFISHLGAAEYADGHVVEDRFISTIVGHKVKDMTMGEYNKSQATREQIKGVINLIDYTLPDAQEVLGEPRSAALLGMME
jgi:integrase